MKLINLLTLATALLAPSFVSAQKVGMYIDADIVENIISDQERLAAEWFRDNYVNNDKGIFITNSTDFSTLTTDNYSTIWFNIDRVGYNQNDLTTTLNSNIDHIKNYFNNGGSLYLSKMANDLVMLLGRTPMATNLNNAIGGAEFPAANWWGINQYINYNGVSDGWYRDNTNHPIYENLTFTHNNELGCDFDIIPIVGCTDDNKFSRFDHNWCWDLNGLPSYLKGDGVNKIVKFEETFIAKVLGTWNHVKDDAVATVVEFYPVNGQGRIIANGASAYQWNEKNIYADNVSKLTDNTLKYLVNNNRQSIYLALWIDADNVGSLGSVWEKNAAEWFLNNLCDKGQGEFITNQTPVSVINKVNYRAIWINICREGYTASSELPAYLKNNLQAFKDYYCANGNFLLTTYGNRFAYDLGRIASMPNEWGTGLKGNEDTWGINQDFANSEYRLTGSSHPIFSGLTTIDWVVNAETTNRIFPMIGGNHDDDTDFNCFWKKDLYTEDVKNYRFLGTWNHETSDGFPVLVQFDARENYEGCIIACGAAAYQWNSSNVAEYQQNVETFTVNTLNYLQGYTWSAEGGGVSGVDRVVAPDTDAPVHFFNLNGSEVNAENLLPGIYVRVQGNNATKILVK